jgi:hypothetical protein
MKKGEIKMEKIMKSSIFKPLILFLATLMVVFHVSPSVSKADTVDLSDLEEMERMSDELEFYFDVIGEFSENGDYIIKNEELLKELIDAGDPNALEVYELSKLSHDSFNPDFENEMNSAATFGKCVVNKMISSYGNIARQFLNGSIYIYIKNKQFDLAAKLMFGTLIKGGIKVNAIGLAAEVAYYGWQCRGAW